MSLAKNQFAAPNSLRKKKKKKEEYGHENTVTQGSIF